MVTGRTVTSFALAGATAAARLVRPPPSLLRCISSHLIPNHTTIPSCTGAPLAWRHPELCRDLKSKNVLLTANRRAKVADVGAAALHSATYLSGARGLLAVHAPYAGAASDGYALPACLRPLHPAAPESSGPAACRHALAPCTC